ncbi:hypothetical protein [Shewanella acanthi]|uniref:hypothetical protein n=1 Tax=Shewanella acanthi TaxID=2864212 RepID=UPI001C655074|nr:hypothetical protein [Shewanella acanthi]QYJ80369.1 hypothetical protein K0H61_08350 [Shewanella acanthi]
MKKSILVGVISSVIATGAWAGAPGANTHGSTTISVSENLDDAKLCMTSAPASDSDTASSDSAHAWAFAESLAESYINVGYSGDVYVDLTRHGNNGAVHQVELTAGMGSGTIFAQVAKAGAEVNVDAQATTSEEVQATAMMIAQAVATLFVGPNWEINVLDLVDITIKIGAEAKIEAIASVEGTAQSIAESDAQAAAEGQSDAQSTAAGAMGGVNGSHFYVQGANIEQFETHLATASAAIVDVQTEVLAKVYADAFATSLVYALAEASGDAMSSGQLTFEYDLPIIGSGSLPIVTDIDTASAAAQMIKGASADIGAFATASATAAAGTFASSSLAMGMTVTYENLPGTEDFLEITKTGNLELDCAYVSANAEAQADASME